MQVWDIFQYYLLSKHARDINDVAFHLQRDTLKKEDPDDTIDRVYLESLLDRHALKEQLEFVYIYKVLPCPDVCPYSMVQKQVNMYNDEKRPDYGKETDLTGAFEDVKAYQKWLLISCYYRKHKVCPGICEMVDTEEPWTCRYPYVEPHEIPYKEVGTIKMTGCYKYQSFGTDIMHAVKDKATCPTAVAVVENQNDLGKVDAETNF